MNIAEDFAAGLEIAAELAEQGFQPGSWQLRHRFIAIDPHCPTPLPFPAEPRRWDLYGPLRR